MNCSKWRDVYLSTQGMESDWPEGFQLKGDRLIENGKICVPTPLQEKVIYDHHQFLGHVGFERIWAHMDLRYSWGNLPGAKKFAKEVMGVCEACHACQRPRSLKSRIESTPIPPQ